MSLTHKSQIDQELLNLLSLFFVTDIGNGIETRKRKHSGEDPPAKRRPLGFQLSKDSPKGIYLFYLFLLKSRLQSHFVAVNGGVFLWWD